MTPAELLEQVKARFQVLYVEPVTLDMLLKQAMGVYQDKAGPVRLLNFDALVNEMPVPSDFYNVAVAMDAEGRWHSASVIAGKLKIETTTRSVLPFKVWYFVAMRSMDLKTGNLPDESISLLYEYLTALIEIPNNKRAKEVAVTTGLPFEIPDEETLKQRKDLVEQEIEDNQSMIPMATVY